jgi:methionyl-tRNA formyltransferase
MTDRPRILVFAYHNVGYECLNALLDRGENVIAIFTHEDSPDEEIWFRSVADLARRNGIPVHTPPTVNTPEWTARIREWNPDLIFSFYYRSMISGGILSIPRLGAYNMHGSLLPKYRGRVPVNWAVLNGERETGATLHHMVKRADAGDIVDQQAVPIGPDDTAFEVFTKVTAAAREVLERRIEDLKAGTAPRMPQDEAQATVFGGRRPEDGRIDWTRSAREIYNLVRAVTHPYPGAFAVVNGMRFFIWRAKALAEFSGTPGQVLSIAPLRVATGTGALEIITYQWEGTQEHHAASGLHGLRLGQLLAGKPA